LDPTFAVSLVSGILAFFLAFEVYHAFRFAKQDYLLNFSVGFLLLGLSYVILVPLALGLKLPGHYEDIDDIVNYPVFAVIQTVAYALIALAYGQARRAKAFLIGLLGFLALLILLILLPGSYIPMSIDILLFSLNTFLLGFVLYHMLKIMPPTDLVFAGFLLLGIHEYTSLIAAVNESIYGYPDDGSFFIAAVLRLAGLSLLLVPFLTTRYRVFSSSLEGVDGAEAV
jgi:hypothetical protein